MRKSGLLFIVKPTLQNRKFDDIDPTTHVQLEHGVRLVDFDGLNTETHTSCYFLVTVAEGDKTKHFSLALARVAYVGGPSGRSFRHIPANDFCGHRRIQIILAFGYTPDGGQKYGGWTLLQDVTGNTRLQ